MIAETARNFANSELIPIAAEVDKSHKFPPEVIKKIADLGFMGIMISPEYDGSGMDSVAYAIAMEEISRGCASAGVIMSANNSLYCAPVNKYG
jgi:butyryl-CoA dehydrogenase